MKKIEIERIIKNGRNFLKPDWDSWNYNESDCGKGIKPPLIENDYSHEAKSIDLKLMGQTNCGNIPLPQLLLTRKSTRSFSEKALNNEELSYLLWATQGQRESNQNQGWALRVVPSAGARHCIETYLYIDRVEGIEPGLYRYLPIEDKIIVISTVTDEKEKLNSAMCGQMFNGAIVFIWTANPYKMEYRYTTVAHKMIAIEAGHICQSLYLSAESINCGCCAISGYSQVKADQVINVDGEEEFVVYMGVVGKY